MAGDGFTAVNKSGQALVIQPGAIGDVILTLPFVQFLKSDRHLEQVDMMGHLDRLTYLQGRSQIDDVFSIDNLPLHQLFLDPHEFELELNDPLIEYFSRYKLIITFLNDDKGFLLQNLIYVSNMTSPTDVVPLELKPDDSQKDHVSVWYQKQLIHQMVDMDVDVRRNYLKPPEINANDTCRQKGMALCEKYGLDSSKKLIAIHPGSGGENKCWPLNKFLDLAVKLQREGCCPFFILGPTEIERWDAKKISMCHAVATVLNDISIEEIADILSVSSGYYGNDSGISHLAGALIPTNVFFLESNPNHWKPVGDQVEIIVKHSQDLCS